MPGSGWSASAFGKPFRRNVDRFVTHHRQPVANEAFDAVQIAAFGHVAKGHGGPTGTGACRSTYAMHIILGLVRKLIVDNMADARHVKAPAAMSVATRTRASPSRNRCRAR